MVPNIVFYQGGVAKITDKEKVRIFYDRLSGQNGRWNNKKDNTLEKALKKLAKQDLIEITEPTQNLTPDKMLTLRQFCHITIDDLVSGSFHRISMEGLACGNLTINNADDISMLTLEEVHGKAPPFYRTEGKDIQEVLNEIIHNKDFIRKKQEEFYEFYQEYLLPQRLIRRYLGVY